MVEINLNRLEEGLRAGFPSLKIFSPLSIIGSGFNSTVVEVGETIIFRIGKNPIAQEGYEKERSCLPRMAPYIPFMIPNPTWHIKNSPYFPFGAMGYPKIPGLPLQPNISMTNLNHLAGYTAKFLLALHRISPDVLEFQSAADLASKWEVQYQEVLPLLKDKLTVAEFRLIKRWRDDSLLDKKMKQYHPLIQHGDLWYENMLVDASMEKLVGIVDWERLDIGDPAQDFATLLHLGENFVRLVIRMYGSLGGELDEHFEYRMQRLWEAREFEGLHYAIKFDDPIELKDALRKIRQGPILKKSRT